MIVKMKPLGAVVVAAAGTAATLSSSDLTVHAVVIQAEETNTGNIYVSDSTVDDANGHILTPGEPLTIDVGLNMEINLADMYIDADVNGDGVRVNYITSRGA